MYRQALKNMYKAAASEGQGQSAGDPSFTDQLAQGWNAAKDKGQQALDWTQNTLNDAKALTAEQAAALAAALSDKKNYSALATLGAAGLGGLGGAALGDNAEERIINALTGAAGGAGAVGGARGAMELLEGNVDPLLAAGIGGVTGGIGSGALARLLAKTLMK